jgi:hypothetical protein
MRKRSFLLIRRLWNIASWNGDFCHLWTKRTVGLCLSARAGAIRTGLPCLIRSAASLKVRKAAVVVAIETTGDVPRVISAMAESNSGTKSAIGVCQPVVRIPAV